MIAFFRAGGFPMFLLLPLGLLAILAALRGHARAPSLARATALVTGGAFALDLAAVCAAAPDLAAAERAPVLPIVLTGVGESLSPVVLGLLLLAGVALASRHRAPAAVPPAAS